ncbi:MAG: hypothetical protein ACN4GG_01935 [Akkermansiaceae bacterium]
MIRSLSVVFSLGLSSFSQGTVLLFDPADVGFYSTGRTITHEIDLDSDGINDLQLRSNRADFGIFSLQDNTSVAVFLTGGNDLGGNSLPYIAGDTIGADLPNPAQWFTSMLGGGSANIISCRDIGCIGNWRGGVNYAGIRIEDEQGNFRYGWLEIDAQISLATGGVLTRYAFETETNKAITVIPEPSSTLLFSLTLPILLLRRR